MALATPLGGGSTKYFGALVVIEPAGEAAETLLESVEQQAETPEEAEPLQDPVLRQIQEELDEEG